MLIDLDHIRLNVVDEGEGDDGTLLLLHGMGANHRIWTFQLDAFHGELRVVAPDLRGCGQSDLPPGPYPIESFADDVAALCERIGVERATVVGQSMGGGVAQALVVRHPDLVERLVLVGTRCPDRHGPGPAAQTAPLHDVIVQEGVAGVPGRIMDAIYPRRFQSEHPERVWHFTRELLSFDADALLAALHRTVATDFAARLPEVAAPTLIVAGAHDRICPPEESEYLKQLMPDAELVVLDDCGHQPFYEDPDMFNALLREFIRATPIPRSTTVEA